MTIIPGQLYTPGAGPTPASGQSAQQPEQARSRHGGTAPPTGGPREAVPETSRPRPVLDLSDAALTRRDLPRGSLVNIVA